MGVNAYKKAAEDVGLEAVESACADIAHSIQSQLGRATATLPEISEITGLSVDAMRLRVRENAIRGSGTRRYKIQTIVSLMADRIALKLTSPAQIFLVEDQVETTECRITADSFFLNLPSEETEGFSVSAFRSYLVKAGIPSQTIQNNRNQPAHGYLPGVLEQQWQVFKSKHAKMEEIKSMKGYWMDEDLGLCGKRPLLAEKFKIGLDALNGIIKRHFGGWKNVPHNSEAFNEQGRTTTVYQVRSVYEACKYVLKSKYKVQDEVCTYVDPETKENRTYVTAQKFIELYELPLSTTAIYNKMQNKYGEDADVIIKDAVDRNTGKRRTVMDLDYLKEAFADQIAVKVTIEGHSQFEDPVYGFCLTIPEFMRRNPDLGLKEKELRDLIAEAVNASKVTKLRRRVDNNDIIDFYVESQLQRLVGIV